MICTLRLWTSRRTGARARVRPMPMWCGFPLTRRMRLPCYVSLRLPMSDSYRQGLHWRRLCLAELTCGKAGAIRGLGSVSLGRPHWSVVVGGKTVYRGTAKPTERPHGRLELPTGQSFERGKCRVVEHKADSPLEISGRGSVPPKSCRPGRNDPALGFSDENVH